MRWTLTSPDGLGDFLLRLPWLLAMQKAGWKLQLLCRTPTAELAELCGINAEFVPLRLSPYSKEARRRLFPFRREIRSISRFKPDTIFLGPSQPTFLEEQIVQKLRGANVGGFRVNASFWPGEGMMEPAELCKMFSFVVDVSGEDSEPVRNAKAAAYMLGRESSGPLSPFRFSAATVEALPKSKAVPSRYLVVCAGYREGDYFKGWGSENWAAELRALQQETALPLVFVGGSPESAAHREIFAALASSDRNVDLTGRCGDLRELCGVLAGAETYIGKDCGAMHLSSALGKPVVAVFGGGHRNRFHPTGTRAVALSVDVPCRGCDWRCHLAEPTCVRGLAPGSLLAGWRFLQEQRSDSCANLLQPLESNAKQDLGFHEDASYPARAHAAKRRSMREDRRKSLWWLGRKAMAPERAAQTSP